MEETKIPLPKLTETTIRQHASAESFERGRDYYQQGAVLSLVQRGHVLQAQVEGSGPFPYTVSCTFDDTGIVTAICTCPYDWGGWCKHIVATCLAYIHQPETIEVRPPFDTLLTDLNRDQLQSLLLKVVEREPGLAEFIEGQIALFHPVSSPVTPAPPMAAPAPTRHIHVDPKAVRRQIRSAIHGLDRMRDSEAYWHVGEVVDDVRQLVDQAWTLIKADDGRNALILLEAITEEYIDEWENLDDSDGEAGGFFEDLGSAWTEALLTADLTSEERELWADKLNTWQQELEDYGVDEAFDAPQTAVIHGWDYPPLQRVLQGTITDQGAWEGDFPDYADDIAEARLRILDRRGRWQEYLYLAEAEGHTEEYVTMLVRLDRIQEAITYGQEYLATAGAALALAQALYNHGEREQSLQMAEHGLTLQGPKAQLATWLRDQAAAMGKTEQALTAAEITFREEPSLANYLRAAELAGERWPERREALLDYARHVKSYYPQGPVDIFLHEGLIDDAIGALEPYASHTLVEQVVDAALETRPDWVIQACRQQAERIMNEGRAQLYDAAARWLAKARTAYRAMGREEEWQTYLSELLIRHGRKYKLVPMLQALR